MQIKSFRYTTNVKSRSDLLTLLTEACEIEHGLACSYLYSAFSLKQEVDEGLSAIEVHHVKKWSSNIFFIASQEMLHLAQAWNLLTAIGGTPYYLRPNFPQNSKYYPFNVPLKLEPFSMEALKRFILYELPQSIDEKKYALQNFGYFSEDNYNYKTVGELYGLIKSGFENIPEEILFIGDPSMQMGTEETDFREIVKVIDKATAVAAIDMIMEQGEGNIDNRENSHYGLFCRVEEEYKKFLSSNPSFQPARNVITNPVVFQKGNYSADQGELLINEKTRELSDIFDDIYNLMLRVLQYSFSNNNKDKHLNKLLTAFSINIMIRVIKPFGELLTYLPAYNDLFFKKAGPSFSMNRHIPLPDNNPVTLLLIKERLNEISNRLQQVNYEDAFLNNKIKSVQQIYTDVSNMLLQKELSL